MTDVRVGIQVFCEVCGWDKKPHGRSVPGTNFYCTPECDGYYEPPLPGCLFPNERSDDFGYACCTNATRPLAAGGGK